ncbi:MAG: hypothetical protein KDI03_07570 [Anaerolineae bacterium]|nr:hypothetical protein [Anaerolineae bacterium]MCB0205885.1 hypothetical protein [Anaerolineae bacterium]MCB0255794.1 hypothetical protein [Anaerolineae bacterium]
MPPHPTDVANDLFWREVAPQGFGDRHNSWPWSMLWWKNRLYVGTNRAWHCAERASLNRILSWFVPYPPKDPEAACTQDPRELPLQAEIWSWRPETDSWERLYQSPKNIVVDKRHGVLTARDIGYRNMAIFSEPDGTEALFVSGVSSRFIFRPFRSWPPARILRSVDGQTFSPVPQEPGTFLGNARVGSFRTLVAYRDRLFVLAGSIRGDGVLLEATHPARGNNSFRQVSPAGMYIFEMALFNGYLYVGLRDSRRGYSVCKTNASGEPPYRFTTVVKHGAHATRPSYSVISMHTFRGRLYVGTDRPAEVIRINPDDTWDLVCGEPRQTPLGWRHPISGLDTGFGNWLNGHIWRMQEHQGRLFVGTWNMATDYHHVTGIEEDLRSQYGFHLYETTDGSNFTPITTGGFGDMFSNGIRSFASTPHGLFLGAANQWKGLRIWQGTGSSAGGLGDTLQVHLSPPAPGRLDVEMADGVVVLSWTGSSLADSYQIYRARVEDLGDQFRSNKIMTRLIFLVRVLRLVTRVFPVIYSPQPPDQIPAPGPYMKIGGSRKPLWIDSLALPGARYLYLVRTKGATGKLSPPSNIVLAPPTRPAVTARSVQSLIEDHVTGRQPANAAVVSAAARHLAEVRQWLNNREPDQALAELEQLLRILNDHRDEHLDQLLLDDLAVNVAKLQRRVQLCRQGLIPATLVSG